MAYSLYIRPDAEADLASAYEFYEECRDGLGSDFLLCVEEGFSRIQHNPESYPCVHKDIRRLLIHRFPYSIFYTPRGSRLIVLAVLHCARAPATLKART
ncbi:type II toxin-antitoxin system RelE/ParE family toxin [Microbulbifer sp. Q7]|uniref:type II toxin-antitoxin system RelE/ParE family toxin n=1 Tax=Microbulbifer sp. Q7 TaxID=1785091 RepID=UPI0009EF5DA0